MYVEKNEKYEVCSYRKVLKSILNSKTKNAKNYKLDI